MRPYVYTLLISIQAASFRSKHLSLETSALRCDWSNPVMVLVLPQIPRCAHRTPQILPLGSFQGMSRLPRACVCVCARTDMSCPVRLKPSTCAHKHTVHEFMYISMMVLAPFYSCKVCCTANCSSLLCLRPLQSILIIVLRRSCL